MDPVSRETVDGIPGVELVRLPVWPDDRGWFREVFRSVWAPEQFKGDVQLNLSLTRAGGLRGLHFHRVQSDWWVPVSGSIRAVVADLRPESPAFLRTSVLDLSADEPLCLFVPPMVAHGFLALTDAKLLYAVNRFYDGTDEQGVAWDDPTLAVNWGTGQPVLSERDMKNPGVKELFPVVELRNRS
jgi:dTDP-4-dehydrorhamnose 3,5-epimerase